MAEESSKDPSSSDEHNDVSKEAAGVVRGVSRSIVRAPMIGRLPRPQQAIFRQRLPVRQVARVSDRLATGLDWWTSAVESEGTQRWPLIRSFAKTLVKNTLLGMAVFESYGYIIGQLAPTAMSEEEELHDDLYKIDRTLIDDDGNSSEVVALQDEPDEYSKASISTHLVAGSIAGGIHGVASSAMEGHFKSYNWQKHTALNTIHHSIAHSSLFASYELIKRCIIQQLHVMDESTQYFGGAYLTTFGIAGGVAGQIQHLTSHYMEQSFGLTNPALRHVPIRNVVAPPIRPLLWSFPPSAIGFIAFEYGKKLTS